MSRFVMLACAIAAFSADLSLAAEGGTLVQRAPPQTETVQSLLPGPTQVWTFYSCYKNGTPYSLGTAGECPDTSTPLQKAWDICVDNGQATPYDPGDNFKFPYEWRDCYRIERLKRVEQTQEVSEQAARERVIHAKLIAAQKSFVTYVANRLDKVHRP